MNYKPTFLRVLWKRLRLSYRFRVWPWSIPWQAVYLSLEQPTPGDIARTRQLFRGEK